MKSNNLFRDQVNSVTNLFEKWSECEQTVALCTLFKQISPTQCRFLAQVLDQTDCADIGQTENEANDPVYIHKLANNDSKEYAIAQLLAHLPLLRTGENQAKVEYLSLISSILGYTIQNGTHIEESRQIISYSLMHPAITSDERSEFTLWIGKLEEQFTYSIHPQQKKSVKDEESISQSLENLNISNNATHKPVGSGRTNGWHVHPPGEPLIINTMDPMSVPPNGLLITQQNLINQRQHQVPPPPPLNGSHVSYNLTANKSHHLPLQPTKSAPPNFVSSVPSSQSSLSSGSGSRVHQPLVRTPSVSVMPPCSIPVPNHISDWLQASEDQSSHSSSDRGRSHSMTSDHAPLSPQSSITSSSSSSGDTHQDDGPQPVKNSFLEEGSGMRDVPLWLKTLRLHKYAYIFQQLTYEEMMNLTEEWLESQVQWNVTKGARTKIVLSLNKLRERQSLLRSLEKEMMDGGSVKAALTEMKVIINTPMKAFSQETDRLPSSGSEGGDYSYIAEGDLVAQFTRVMGKVCTQLLTASRPDDECFNLYLSLIDKCINHEAFTYRQKKLLSTWKQETQRIYQPPLKYSMDRKLKPGWGNTFPLGASLRGGLAQKVPRQPRAATQWSFGAKRSIVGGTTSGHLPLTRNTSLNPALFSRPGFIEGKQQVTRTHSAPLRSPNLGLAVSDCESSADSAENYAQLDSLCMSVTEHALGGSDSGDKGSGF